MQTATANLPPLCVCARVHIWGLSQINISSCCSRTPIWARCSTVVHQWASCSFWQTLFCPEGQCQQLDIRLVPTFFTCPLGTHKTFRRIYIAAVFGATLCGLLALGTGARVQKHHGKSPARAACQTH